MSANDIDLSGFPVVRIDQIPLIDSDTLVQAQKDVKSLIASLLGESDTVPPMVHYLRKQNEATSSELMNRLAQERINSLLSGATTLLNNDRSKYVLDEDDDVLPKKASTETVIKTPIKGAQINNNTTPVAPAFQPVPLPSEIRSKRVSSLAASPVFANSANASAPTASTNSEQPTSPLNRSKSSPAGIAMSSSRSVSERERGGRRMDSSSHDEYAGSESSPPRRRPLSGDVRPSKRSQEFINNNFGNLFIVAGDGRRRRPLVKKVPAESIEVIKARERLERRKAAMQRLLDRKAEREKLQLAKREAKRAAQREAEQAAESNTTISPLDSPSSTAGKEEARLKAKSTSAKKDKSKDQLVSSSGSESVSGGDDDDGAMQVEVDEKMVQALVTAEQQDAAGASQESLSIVEEPSLVGDAGISTNKSTAQPMQSPQVAPVPVTNAPQQGKSRRVRPAVEAARGSQNKTHPATTNGTNSASPQILNTNSTDTSKLIATKSMSTTSKRKSAYRTDPSPDTASTETTLPTTITHNNEATTEDVESLQQERLESSSNATGEEETEAPQVTEQELIDDFEAKNFAALQSLRNMKLKKEQQRMQSVKSVATETVNAAADTNDSIQSSVQPLAPQPSGEIDEPTVFNADVDQAAEKDSPHADVNMLTQSVDSGIYPFFPRERTDSVSSNEMNENNIEKEPPPPTIESAELYLKSTIIPPRPLSRVASSNPAPVVTSRPVSRMVRESTVNVYQDDSAVGLTEAVHSNAELSSAPVRSASPPILTNGDAHLRASSRPASGHAHMHLSVAQSIDLSQTALAMSIDASALLSPEPSRKSHGNTLWGPRDPVVAALLAGVKNSALLYVADGVYCCERGAEDLPGLSAWKLVSIVDECANWVVNLNKYTETVVKQENDDGQKSDTFLERSAIRKSVSLGLLVLLLDCEDLLLGSVHLYNSEHFTTLWQEYIRLFDLKAESISMQFGPQALFTQVGVCGNTHTVCRKLENILKTIFTTQSAAEARLHRKLHAKDGDIPAQVGRLTIPAEDSTTGNSRQFNSTEDITPIEHSKTDQHQSVHSPQTSIASLDYSHTTPRDTASNTQRNLQQTETISDSDDDASIVPTYTTNLGSEEKNIEESAYNIAEHFVRKNSVAAVVGSSITENSILNETSTNYSTVPAPAAPPMSATSTITTLQNTPYKKTPAVKAETSASISTSSAVSLTDYYPTIGSIFPAAYSQTASAKPAEDGSAAARSLLQCMQVQCKIYEEWLEVMSDYSTVFCDDRRGVAEHYYGSHSKNDNNGTSEEGNDQDGSSTVYKGGTRSLHFRVKSARSEVNNIVTDVFNNFLQQWEELPSGLGLGLSWNILWTWSKPRIKLNHLLVWQKVNHYPDSKELTRKDLLKKNIQRYTVMGGKGGENFNIMPMTFLLPHEYTAFVQAFTAIEASKHTSAAIAGDSSASNINSAENSEIQNFWILKPLGMSRGRGISLVKDLSQIAYSVSSVVQRYIERPLCLKGYKFDLRLYILVTSFRPLEAFIYRDGFARVSTHQYSLNPADTENKFIHLTNSSIQVQNTEGPTKDSPLQTEGEDEQDTGGTKISLLGNNGLWKRLQEFGIDIPSLWQSISSLVIKSLVMVDDKITHQPNCFEMFGYDVLIDSDLRPWLLEVNASPSLARPSPLDVRVKNAMIKDIISLLDVAPYDRAAVLRVLNRRLQQIAKNRVHTGKNDPELESDLRDILGDYTPRKYGELPKEMGNYELLAPNTKEYERVLKLKRKIIKS